MKQGRIRRTHSGELRREARLVREEDARLTPARLSLLTAASRGQAELAHSNKEEVFTGERTTAVSSSESQPCILHQVAPIGRSVPAWATSALAVVAEALRSCSVIP